MLRDLSCRNLCCANAIKKGYGLVLIEVLENRTTPIRSDSLIGMHWICFKT